MLKEKQIVTIHSDGSISGLERPSIFDFKQLGHAKVQRTSEIKWSESEQMFYVYFIHLGIHLKDDNGKTIFFTEYEAAKVAEVAYLDALRVKGQIPKLT